MSFQGEPSAVRRFCSKMALREERALSVSPWGGNLKPSRNNQPAGPQIEFLLKRYLERHDRPPPSPPPPPPPPPPPSRPPLPTTSESPPPRRGARRGGKTLEPKLAGGWGGEGGGGDWLAASFSGYGVYPRQNKEELLPPLPLTLTVSAVLIYCRTSVRLPLRCLLLALAFLGLVLRTFRGQGEATGYVRPLFQFNYFPLLWQCRRTADSSTRSRHQWASSSLRIYITYLVLRK